MENKTNNTPDNKPGPKKSWFERNLWLVAVFIAIFLMRMCSELSK